MRVCGLGHTVAARVTLEGEPGGAEHAAAFDCSAHSSLLVFLVVLLDHQRWPAITSPTLLIDREAGDALLYSCSPARHVA